MKKKRIQGKQKTLPGISSWDTNMEEEKQKNHKGPQADATWRREGGRQTERQNNQ